MKNIEIDDDLYQYIASNTCYIGESASQILRRLLAVDEQDVEKVSQSAVAPEAVVEKVVEPLVSEQAPQDESITSGNLFDLINKEELATQRGAVGRFLLILAALYRCHTSSFPKVLGIRGRDRLYFSTSEAELSASGSSTKPRQIPGSEFWVMTNSNTTRKKMMLTESAKVLGYSDEQIEKIRDLL